MRVKVVNALTLPLMLVVLFALNGTARGYNTQAYLKAALPIAQGAWATRCVDPPAVYVASMPDTRAGLSEWEFLPSDPSSYFDCRVTINADIPFSFAEFCETLVHEFGHLAGLEHSADPQSVMYPVLGPIAYPGCRTAHGRRVTRHRRPHRHR